MTKPSTSFWVYSIIFLFFGLFLIWFFRNYEYVTEDIYVGYQGKARHNNLYAAQLLIEKMGIPSETIRPVNKLHIETLNTQDTIVLKQNDYALAEFYTERMLYWVSQGGHLILNSSVLHSQEYEEADDDEVGDYFLQRLQVLRQQNDNVENNATAKFNWQGYKLEVDLSLYYYLESENFTSDRIETEYGTQLLSFVHGNGRVTILSELDFIKNDEIGDYDHAQFLWLLVNFDNRQPSKVWLVLTSGGQFPSFFELLWKNMKWILISGGVWLVIWLWYVSRRFGFILPVPEKSRRRLLEHVEASGQFLWQQKQSHYLLHRVQQQTWQRLAIVHPQWLHLPQDQLCQHLADITQIQALEINHALELAQTSEQAVHIQFSETDFTRAIQVFNMIRKVL
ncbi:DUF4350 domain-containing protein [Candidatus Albibeggiatoa sp. nov. NOAA]|uniref:DUF4350 domain-containing protein n=1 Tax=Candidatus Albibeggiatoa sp. nov. NOAA TaxID=3162724 RepID=UPI0032F67A6A|nr:hypothetical protein [Thiotrichaceae bacterium]